MSALVANPNDAQAAATIARDARYRSMLRTSCVATMLSGGHARNALPQTATANVNCRMAPGHDPADVRAGLVAAANDTGVQVSRGPAMETGATYSKYLRSIGIPGYGISSLFGDPNDNRAHGRDERVLIKSYYDS